MAPIPRLKPYEGPALFSYGFRPFFLFGALYAGLAVLAWLPIFTGELTMASAFTPRDWHVHEMLYGYVPAVVTGFLLTAIPNWTGRLPIAGLPLAGLAGLWAAARLAVLFSAVTGSAVAALLDIGFYLVLAGFAAREVLAAKNRNLPLVGIVLLLGVANSVDHAAALGLLPDPDIGARAAIALIVMMISLVGGRIVPSFTRNWMTKQGMTERLPLQPTRFDMLVLGASGIALLAWVAFPDSPATGWLLLGAGLLQTLRLSRWGGLRSARDPLVLILHVGYLWVAVGLLLLGVSILDASIPRSAAIHALTAGAMSTMILAVMTRATLGHTGRALVATKPTILLYCLVTLGAVLRVTAGLGLIDYAIGRDAAAVAWATAFVLYLATYGPMLFGARPGEENA